MNRTAATVVSVILLAIIACSDADDAGRVTGRATATATVAGIAPTLAPTTTSQPVRTWITPAEARSHVGSRRTVCGTVASATYASGSRGQPTFLNLDRAYPNQIFTALIWGQNRSEFGSPPESIYRGQDICVVGLIEWYDGEPEIVVTGPSQISLQ